jgi:hypothetical protein
MTQPKKIEPFKSTDALSIIKGLVVFASLICITVLVVALISKFTFAHGRTALIGVAGIWVFLSYIAIPRVHRSLTRLYVPDYYIGRARTGEGLLCDPINVAFTGTKKDIVKAMKKAGWTQAEKMNAKTAILMAMRTLARKSYPNAPVHSMYLFNKKQDFTFQQEIGGKTSKRHHIRFWKTPKGWYLPGGAKADWLAAATYDKKVGFSLFTLQITHKINADIDEERDFVLKTLTRTNSGIKIDIKERFSSAYHDINGGGDLIKTDGSMPFVRFH